MKTVSRIALGMAVLLTTTAIVAPAEAQRRKKEEPAAATPGQRTYELSKEERKVIEPLQKAVTAQDWATSSSLLPAAQAAAKGTDAKYVIGQFQLQIGLGLKDVAMQEAAINAMLASGGVAAADLPIFYKNQAALAAGRADYVAAEAAYTKAVELDPTDSDAMINLAEVKNDLKKYPEAIAMLDRAIEAKKASGQPVPENWYKRGLSLAFDAKLGADANRFSRGLIVAYPNQKNWRDALLVYRDTSKLDAATNLDLMRLMRNAKALTGDGDFYELADELDKAGLPGETKAVLDEGIAMKIVDPNKMAFRELSKAAAGRVKEDQAWLAGLATKAMASPTGRQALTAADAYFGYGEYDKAIPLYRAALQKGSIDANVANTRLGMALALSGQKAEAETVFKAINGPRSDLAAFWLVWLSQNA